MQRPASPIFIWIFAQARLFGFYGVPSLDGKTIKLATQRFTATSDSYNVPRTVDSKEQQSLYKDYVENRMP